jgi:hypothetical protein
MGGARIGGDLLDLLLDSADDLHVDRLDEEPAVLLGCPRPERMHGKRAHRDRDEREKREGEADADAQR